MPIAGRVTGCGRAGRVKKGRYHPRPFSSLLPLTHCGAGDWMWVTGRAGRVDGWGAGCGFIIPPLPPPSPSLLPPLTRCPPPPRLPPPLPLPPSHPLRGGCAWVWSWLDVVVLAACPPPSLVARRVTGRAGRVGDWRLDVVVLAAGHYHAPPHFPPFPPLTRCSRVG